MYTYTLYRRWLLHAEPFIGLWHTCTHAYIHIRSTGFQAQCVHYPLIWCASVYIYVYIYRARACLIVLGVDFYELWALLKMQMARRAGATSVTSYLIYVTRGRERVTICERVCASAAGSSGLSVPAIERTKLFITKILGERVYARTACDAGVSLAKRTIYKSSPRAGRALSRDEMLSGYTREEKGHRGMARAM